MMSALRLSDMVKNALRKKKTVVFFDRSLLSQADETAEALDAAAVEAALSLCEENSHALSGAWAAGPFQPHNPHPTMSAGVQQSLNQNSSLEGKKEVFQAEGEASASLPSLCSSQDNCFAVFPVGLRGPASTSSSSCISKSLEHCHNGATLQPVAMIETGETVHLKSQISSDVTIKCDNKRWAQQRVKSSRGTYTHALILMQFAVSFMTIFLSLQARYWRIAH